MTTPTDRHIAHARAIAANPGAHTPRVRARAWITLKQARGQQVREAALPRILPCTTCARAQDRAPTAAPTLAQTLDLKAPAIRARIRQRARELGLIAATPTGGDAA